MASPVTSAYVVGITIESDASGLTTAATTASSAVSGLAADVSAATDTINADLTGVGDQATTTFGTTVPAATDKAAVDLSTKASKFKAVGTELGTQVAQGVAGGVDPATSAVNVGSSLSGLLAASASTAKGAAAAVGLGLGVALISNVVQGIKQKQEEAAAALAENIGEYEQLFIEGLGRIQAAARKAQIEADFLDPDSVLREAYDLADKLGGISWTDVQKALYGSSAERTQVENEIQQTLANIQNKREKIEQIAASEVLLQGEMTVETTNTLNKLRDAEDATRELAKLSGLEADAREDARTSTQRHLDALREADNLTRKQAKSMNDSARNTADAAASSERYADNLDRAAAAADRLNASTAALNGRGDTVV